MSDFLRSVNQTKLDTKLLIEASEQSGMSGEEESDSFTGSIISVIQLLEAKGFVGKKRQDLLLAIQFRLTALAYVLESGVAESGGFSFEDHGDGGTFIHEVMFKAAAFVPLIEVNEQARFDRDEFFREVLRISDVSGKA